MANIELNEDAQLDIEMEAMTVNTEGHCDEWNRRHKQLLENDQYLNEEQKKIKEPEFTVAEKRENIASKEKLPNIFGKIAKFFTDLKTVAFSGKYSDLIGTPAIVNNNTVTEAGSALDARQANPTIEGTLGAQIAQLNSNLCIRHYNTVDVNVFKGDDCKIFIMNGINLPPNTSHGFLFSYFYSGEGFVFEMNGITLQFFIPWDFGQTKIFFRRIYHTTNTYEEWIEK